jgi:hypothetical protein
MKTWKILVALFAALAPAVASADLEALKQDAMSGKVDSQLELGMLYEFGYRYPDHDVDALAWYTIAADNGNKLAGERRAVVEGRLSPALREGARARANELRALMPAQPAPQDGPAETGDDAAGASAAEVAEPAPDTSAAGTAEPAPAPSAAASAASNGGAADTSAAGTTEWTPVPSASGAAGPNSAPIEVSMPTAMP